MIPDLWSFARPQLEPTDATIITKSGPEGFACYTKGNTHIIGPPNGTAGYVDGE